MIQLWDLKNRPLWVNPNDVAVVLDDPHGVKLVTAAGFELRVQGDGDIIADKLQIAKYAFETWKIGVQQLPESSGSRASVTGSERALGILFNGGPLREAKEAYDR